MEALHAQQELKEAMKEEGEARNGWAEAMIRKRGEIDDQQRRENKRHAIES